LGQYITGILTGISISDIIDIAIVTFIVYHLLGFLTSSRAAQLAKGIMIVIIIAFLADLCHFYVLSWMIGRVLSIGLIALVVVFQPELRRALDFLGRSRIGLKQPSMSAEYNMTIVESIVKSVEYFSARKEGALIVVEQETALDDVAESGTIVDAKITTEALNNIFYKGAPLHDGAVILRGDRIYSAACVLPLTQNQNLSRDLGTRHRAGIGISEVSDALVIIVSEETGIISTARNGKLSGFLDLKSVEKQLLDAYLTGGQEDTLIAKVTRLWRKIDGKS
jgi:diadenylate cyclase